MTTVIACGGESTTHDGGEPSSKGGGGGTPAGAAGNPTMGGAGGLASGGSAGTGGSTETGGSAANGGSAGMSGPDTPNADLVPSCFEPVDPGPCTDFTTRYHWDVSTNQCQPFMYGGCEGNDNNFISYDSCAHYCWGDVNCSCAAGQANCNAGVCNDCPLEAGLADGKPCDMVGLSCTTSGHCDCIVGDSGAKVWSCRVRVL